MVRLVGLQSPHKNARTFGWPLNASLVVAWISCLLPTTVAAQSMPATIAVQAGQREVDSAVASPAELQPVIDGREVACRAAESAELAQLLRSRARTILQLYCKQDKSLQKVASVMASFLQLQASHQEDAAAAMGMRAYYTRIALAEQLKLNELTLEYIAVERNKLLALRQGGMTTGTDLSAFSRQEIEASDQRLQLETRDRQLRSVLLQGTKLDYACREVSQEQLEVHAQVLDCSSLQQLALANRHDLHGWRLLAASVNSQSATEFAKLLPSLAGGWPLPIPSLSALKQLFCSADSTGLAVNLRRELNLTVTYQVEAICQAVAQKCSQLEMAYQRIVLAERLTDSWRERLSQLQQLDESGVGKPEEVALAQVELLKARGVEIVRRLEARMAEIDLAESTGALANRCCRGQAWLLTGLNQ